MNVSVTDGICLSLYVASIALSCIALANAVIYGIFYNKKWNVWYKVFQGCLVGTMLVGFEYLLSPAYMTGKTAAVFKMIFSLAQDATMGFIAVLLPFFLTWIIVAAWGRLQRGIFYPVGIIYILCSIAYRIVGLKVLTYVRTALFAGIYIYCLVTLWTNLKNISDKNSRAICLTVNIVSLCLMPMCILSLFFPVIENFSYPVCVMALSIIMLVFYVNCFKYEHSKSEARQTLTLESLAQWKITDREFDVVKLLTKGLTNKEIAGELNISVNTVNNHVANIFEKTGVRSRIDLLRLLKEGPWA